MTQTNDINHGINRKNESNIEACGLDGCGDIHSEHLRENDETGTVINFLDNWVDRFIGLFNHSKNFGLAYERPSVAVPSCSLDGAIQSKKFLHMG